MKNDQKEISENEIKEQELLEKLAKKQQLTEEEMKSLKGGKASINLYGINDEGIK